MSSRLLSQESTLVQPKIEPALFSSDNVTQVLALPIKEKENFELLRVADQEKYLIDDLLNLLMGIDGTFLAVTEQKGRVVGINMDFLIDDSLKELVKIIAPTVHQYWNICKFVEETRQFEYGMVNHAFSAAISQVLKEYLLVIAQIEQRVLKEGISLQQFWYLLKPNAETLKLLSMLCDKILIATKSNGEYLRGGQLIQMIHKIQVQYSGNPKASSLFKHLLEKASVPFMKMLRKWIHQGVISDSFDEFMIQEKHLLAKEHVKDDFSDVYWDQRYVIRQEYTPEFLELHSEKILLAGKYLNVVKECGVVDFELKKDKNLESEIENAYLSANSRLLELLLQKYSLMDRLKSMKHYFLMDQSDFMVAFMDCAMKEMEQNSKLVSQEHLKSLMELVLRNPSSVSANDPFKDDIYIELSDQSLFQQLMRITTISGVSADGIAPVSNELLAIHAINMSSNIKFPLSLALNKKIMTKYQIMFRWLLLCKYTETKLSATWKHLSSIKTEYSLQMNLLNSKMLSFIQQVMFYGTLAVVEPHWTEMSEKLKNSSTVDELLSIHNDFLDTCLKECTLTNAKLLEHFNSLVDLCINFTKFCTNESELFESSQSTPESVLEYFEISFMSGMSQFMDSLQFYGATETAVFCDLAYRLDYGHFYAKHEARATIKKKKSRSSLPSKSASVNDLLETLDLDERSMDLANI